MNQIDVVMQAGTTNFSYDAGLRSYRVYQGGGPGSDASGGRTAHQNVLVQNVIDEPDGTVDSIGSPSYLSRRSAPELHPLPGRPGDLRDLEAVVVDLRHAVLRQAGKEVSFKPGQTWVLLAPQTSQVSDR